MQSRLLFAILSLTLAACGGGEPQPDESAEPSAKTAIPVNCAANPKACG